ncbi:MAG: hypothetical protein GY858_08385 [Candidatus Omnitrophica bacterium]|nr:hypothetical protein [Candidatus Omnitrophota bacterium]
MRKGIILIAVLTLVVIILGMASAYFSYVVTEKKALDRNLGLIKAFYIAEAGLDRCLSRLKNNITTNLTESFGEGFYSISATNIGGLAYRLTSTGTAQNSLGDTLASKTFSIYVKETPFNVFSYFTNNEYFTQCSRGWCWQTPVWFTTGDALYGPIFTNSEFHIAGDPAFHGPVGSATDEIIYMNGGPPNDNPYFDPAYDPNPSLGQDTIDMPTFDDSNLQDLKADAVNFTGDTKIDFINDGTMTVTNANKGWVNHNMALPAEKSVFVDGGNLYVSGTLDGEMTLGADTNASGGKGNIVVTDNLRFKDRYDGAALRADPMLESSSTNYLGLVAGKDVIVDKNAPSDLEINASIMALGDSFIVERWWDSNYNKGTLLVLGGIIQEERGPVGTFRGDTKISGFSKSYHYDERLLTKNLPYFPTTGEYEVVSWKRN